METNGTKSSKIRGNEAGSYFYVFNHNVINISGLQRLANSPFWVLYYFCPAPGLDCEETWGTQI
jgi:hypothetical protein